MDATGWIAATLSVLVVLLHAGVCLLALGVLPQNRKPSTAMAWLILIISVPGLGILAYALFGETSVGRHRSAWQREVNERVMAALEAEAGPTEEEPATEPAPRLAGLAELNQRLGAMPMRAGNSVEIIPGYAESFEAMRADVEQAREFVHVEFYISSWDEMTDGLFTALAAAAERGVEVRMLFDHLGSRGIPGYKEFTERLRGTRIIWAPMLPLALKRGQVRRPDLRNHRKLLIVDGRVAHAGSQNLIEPGYDKPKNHQLGRHWVDLMARVTGPMVRQFGVVFATDWYAETREEVVSTLRQVEPDPERFAPHPGAALDVAAQVVPSGPGFATENNLRLFNSMIYTAQRRLSLTSPYFVPDESLLYAVTTAAQRGVEVELFVSATADQFMVAHAQRSYYSQLLETGIRIWLYPEPDVLHAKHFTVDDQLAVIGSSNMDYRSFALNFEVVMMFEDRDVVARLEKVQDSYRELSTELTLENWRSRGWGSKYVDNVMRLTAALQ
jgi:cardiolipin synthase